jgi:membrane protease YdiL (CAAX protease family)
VRAVIFAPYLREMGSSATDDTLKELLAGLAPWQVAAGALGGAVACAGCGGVVYMLLRVYVPRRSLPASTSSVLECAAVVCLFVVLGRGIGVAFEHLGWTHILVRMAGTIAASLAAIGALAASARVRRRGEVFSWWDLRPYAGGARMLLVVPVVFVAFVPVNLVVGFAWRCALVALERPTGLQEVLLAPLEQGPAVIAAFAVLAVVVVPLLEEIIFRGGLYRALRDEMGIGVAAVFSATIFAALHFNEAAFVPLIVLSLLFVFVYEWTGSLWACVALHACFNGFNLGLA